MKLVVRVAERLSNEGESASSGSRSNALSSAASLAGASSSLGLGKTATRPQSVGGVGTSLADAATVSDLLSSKCTHLVDDAPFAFIERLVELVPRSSTHLLTGDDVDYFYQMCRSGGKPVPFVPIVDGDLQFYFKKDSLWYSEDLAAVPDRDAGRVAILQGPVAVGFSDKEEPAASILRGIHDGVAQTLLQYLYGDDRSMVPTVDTLAQLIPGKIAGTALGLTLEEPEDAAMLGPDWDIRSKAIQDASAACKAAGVSKLPSWLAAALASTDVASGSTWNKNLLPHLLAKYDDLTVTAVTEEVAEASLAVVGLDVHEASVLPDGQKEQTVMVSLRHTASVVDAARESLGLSRGASTIVAQIFDRIGGKSTRLDLYYYFDPARASCVLLQLPEGGVEPGADGVRISSMHERVRQFYAKLWGSDETASGAGVVSGSESGFSSAIGAPSWVDEGAAIAAVEAETASFEITRSAVEKYAASLRMPVFTAKEQGGGGGGGAVPSPSFGAGSSESKSDESSTLLASPRQGGTQARLRAPTGFSVVASWGALVTPLLQKHVDGNLMDLVHLSHKVESCQEKQADRVEILEGDIVGAKLALTKLVRDARGLLIQVQGTLVKNDLEPWLRIESRFLIRDTSGQHSSSSAGRHGTFYERRAEQYLVQVHSE